jgi:hypothetical protein
MRRGSALALAFLLVAGCAAAPAPVALARVALANPGFEEAAPHDRCAPGWSCSMHADPNSLREEWTAGTRTWQRLALEIDVPDATHDLEVGVALEGTGRACLDDALLEIMR